MDYAGLDYRNIRFPVNRPLTDQERAARYGSSCSSVTPMSFLSVIRFSSTYIDLVDRWYPIKGFNVWLGFAVGVCGVFLAAVCGTVFLWAPESADRSALWFLALLVSPVSLVLAWAGWWLLRTEAWRWTHYPMRLNRKTRKVHVFRQDGTVLTVPWDQLHIFRGEARSPLAGTTYDLRAHVLDSDGETVLETFSLGYTFPSRKDSMDKFWAFLQPYMDAPDGVERAYRHLRGSSREPGYLMPIDDRKEGWRWSVVRTYAPLGHWPWLQLLASPVWSLTVIGRVFAMATSRQPEWPVEVAQTNQIDSDDPYVLTWRDNPPIGWSELCWPLICTMLGAGVFFGAIGATLLNLLE